MSPTEPVTVTPPTLSRQLTLEDVQRIVGAMVLELEMLRRENAALRDAMPRNGKPG